MTYIKPGHDVYAAVPRRPDDGGVLRMTTEYEDDDGIPNRTAESASPLARPPRTGYLPPSF
jgi:hypothetical protein